MGGVIEEMEAAMLCELFKRMGKCPLGDTCPMSHEIPSEISTPLGGPAAAAPITSTRVSVREAIRDAASFQPQKTELIISGVVTVSAPELSRIDISDDGAKLICEVTQLGAAGSELSVGTKIDLTGLLKRKQRRLSFDATSVCIDV